MSAPENFWDTRYAASEDYVFGTQPNAFLARNAQRLKPASRVLLPADGEGRNSVFLAGLGHHVTATDYDAQGIAKARKLADNAGVEVEFIHADLNGWDWPKGEFDAVAAIFIQFAEPDFRDEIFKGIKRALKPGGLILLHGYTPEQLEFKTGGPSQVENLYTEDLLRNAFSDCRIEELRAYEAEINEGAGHAGTSALIDLVAIRG